MNKDPFEFSDELLAYMQGGLEPRCAAQVERMLAESPALRELVDELRHSANISRELKIMARFSAPKRRAKHRLRRRCYAVAAACAALVLGSVALLLRYRDTGQELTALGQGRVTLSTSAGEEVEITRDTGLQELLTLDMTSEDGVLRLMAKDAGASAGEVVYNTIAVAYAGTQVVELPDGTRVHLNSGTTFGFPVPFAEGERRVRITGEGYFEVAPDMARPFIVEAGGMDVRAVGTAFNVKSYGDDRTVSATLTEGVVAVSARGADEVVLAVGQQAVLDRESGAVGVRDVDLDVYTAWKDGMFYFKDSSLDEILRTVARWYDLEVRYAGTPPANVYNGRMPMYSAVEDVLRKFELSGGVGFRLDGRTLTVFANNK